LGVGEEAREEARVAIRIVAYLLAFLVLGGIGLSGAVAYMAMSPEPGSDMVLMALPLIGGPLSLLGGSLLVIVYCKKQVFYKTEIGVLCAIGTCGLLPLALLWVLG
jgi:hypothetical protein